MEWKPKVPNNGANGDYEGAEGRTFLPGHRAQDTESREEGACVHLDSGAPLPTLAKTPKPCPNFTSFTNSIE